MQVKCNVEFCYFCCFVQAFLSGGHPGMPPLAPGQSLSLPDAVRLRDRATILARQMYGADAGAQMADQQVC